MRISQSPFNTNALFKLLQAWQKELNNSEFIGTILIDLSKAYDCLLHDLLIAKLGAYGLDRSSLRLLMDYLSSRKEQKLVHPTERDLKLNTQLLLLLLLLLLLFYFHITKTVILYT